MRTVVLPVVYLNEVQKTHKHRVCHLFIYCTLVGQSQATFKGQRVSLTSITLDLSTHRSNTLITCHTLHHRHLWHHIELSELFFSVPQFKHQSAYIIMFNFYHKWVADWLRRWFVNEVHCLCHLDTYLIHFTHFSKCTWLVFVFLKLQSLLKWSWI